MNRVIVFLAVAALLMVAFSGCIGPPPEPTEEGPEIASSEQASTAMTSLGQGIESLIGSLDQLDQNIGK